MRCLRLVAFFVPYLLACTGMVADALPGDSQEPDQPPQVDYLLVVDSSGSMKEEADAADRTLGAYRALTASPAEDCAALDVGTILAAGMAADLE